MLFFGETSEKIRAKHAYLILSYLIMPTWWLVDQWRISLDVVNLYYLLLFTRNWLLNSFFHIRNYETMYSYSTVILDSSRSQGRNKYHDPSIERKIYKRDSDGENIYRKSKIKLLLYISKKRIIKRNWIFDKHILMNSSLLKQSKDNVIYRARNERETLFPFPCYSRRSLVTRTDETPRSMDSPLTT